MERKTFRKKNQEFHRFDHFPARDLLDPCWVPDRGTVYRTAGCSRFIFAKVIASSDNIPEWQTILLPFILLGAHLAPVTFKHHLIVNVHFGSERERGFHLKPRAKRARHSKQKEELEEEEEQKTLPPLAAPLIPLLVSIERFEVWSNALRTMAAIVPKETPNTLYTDFKRNIPFTVRTVRFRI